MGNKIFQDVPDEIDETWQHGVILGGLAVDAYDYLTVADAYKFTGDMLIDQILISKTKDAYQLIHPILFNYRHCLELYLKNTIKPKPKPNHNIPMLVAELNEYTKTHHNIELPKWVQDVILEFGEFDDRSTAFRYPDVNVISVKTGDIGEFWIDLHTLKDIMNTIQKCFHRLNQDLDVSE